MNSAQASAELMRRFHFTEIGARRLIREARRIGHSLHGNPAGKGHVLLRCDGRGHYSVEIYRRNPGSAIALPAGMDYTSGNAKPRTNQRKRAKAMPPRGKKAAAAQVEEPEAEVEGGEFDHHLTKTLSPTMSDYGDWFHENVADIDELGKSDPGRLLALGSTLYPHFQKSDLNQTRRAARKAERTTATVEEEDPAPARTAARGKAATAGKAAAPARSRGRAKATAEPY